MKDKTYLVKECTFLLMMTLF